MINESYNNDGVMKNIIVAAVCEMVDTFVFGVIASLMCIIKKKETKY